MTPRYQVEWSDRATEQLSQICLDHRDQLAAVAQSADEIDQLLARYPWQTGESRHAPHIRHFYAAPLGIEYEIIEDDFRVLAMPFGFMSGDAPFPFAAGGGRFKG